MGEQQKRLINPKTRCQFESNKCYEALLFSRGTSWKISMWTTRYNSWSPMIPNNCHHVFFFSGANKNIGVNVAISKVYIKSGEVVPLAPQILRWAWALLPWNLCTLGGSSRVRKWLPGTPFVSYFLGQLLPLKPATIAWKIGFPGSNYC